MQGQIHERVQKKKVIEVHRDIAAYEDGQSFNRVSQEYLETQDRRPYRGQARAGVTEIRWDLTQKRIDLLRTVTSASSNDSGMVR
jgi:hypothetical protein